MNSEWFHTQNQNLMAMSTGMIRSNKISMFIFSPQNHYLQVLRPYKYAFTEDLGNQIMSSDPYGSLTNLNGATESCLKAVVPDTQGEVADLSVLDNYYTFALIIETKEAPANMLQSGGPGRRGVLMGYFYGDVPYAYDGYGRVVMQDSALMIFTHVDFGSINARYGNRGVEESLRLLGSSDIVNQAVGASYAPAMALVDYSSIAHSHNFDKWGNSFVRNGQPLTLSEFSNHAAHVPESLKSPKNHLLGITNAAQVAWGAVADNSIISDIGQEIGGGEDPFTSAANVIMGNMQKEGFEDAIYRLIDPTVPCQYITLKQKFPVLDPIPLGFENRPDYLIRNPLGTDPATVFSSMIANSTSAYCRNLLISGISFRYNSEQMSPRTMKKGCWQIMYLSSMLLGEHTPGTTQFHQGEQFKLLMENGLFPMLKSHFEGGGFDIMVHFNNLGDTAVCLNILDIQGEIQEAHADYVITHNRLGGWINPTVGSFETLQSNQIQMRGLVNHVVDGIAGQCEGGLYDNVYGELDHSWNDDEYTGIGDNSLLLY